MKNTDNLKNQTIGIEIEMTGITREKAAQTIAEFFQTQKTYVGGAYHAYEVRMPDGRAPLEKNLLPYSSDAMPRPMAFFSSAIGL